MNRRSFLLGSAAVAVAAVAPAAVRAVTPGGTITGRWSSHAPAWQELSRSQVKALTFAKNYGAPASLRKRAADVEAMADADFSELEARVFAWQGGVIRLGDDPYDVARAC